MFVKLSRLNTMTLDPVLLEVTYEVSVGNPIHPDFAVCCRLEEFAISDCENGCKIYADPLSNVKVLAHNATYGCRK